jgi:hypothetical protein
VIPAREVLTVIAHGEFRPGIIAYGLRDSTANRKASFPYEIWPEQIEVNEYLLHGDRWQVVRWDIQIDRWPQAQGWQDVVRGTLASLIDAGAVVAWLGQEDSSLTRRISLCQSK